jgi:hypothetical protein
MMTEHGLNSQELAEVFSVCNFFRLGEHFPPVLKQFVVGQLRTKSPDLAQTLDDMGAETFCLVLDEIRQRQILQGWGAPQRFPPAINQFPPRLQ